MMVAITGATGAVGARLVRRHLERGDTVRALSRRAVPIAGVEMHRADLSSGDAGLARFTDGADVLYHCAAEINDPARMNAINVEGTRRLMEAARGRIGRWVQLGSIAVYGSPSEGAVGEDTPAAPVTEYGRSKAAADRLVLEAAAGGACACVILRPAKMFAVDLQGGNTAILRRLIAAIDRGVFFFIGRPGATAHYVHIDNVVEALLACGRGAAVNGRAYNLSDDCTIEAFVATLAEALGRDVPRLRLPEAPVRFLARVLGAVPGFPLNAARVDALTGRARFPSERIARELGYRPRVSLEHALRELAVDWKRSR